MDSPKYETSIVNTRACSPPYFTVHWDFCIVDTSLVQTTKSIVDTVIISQWRKKSLLKQTVADSQMQNWLNYKYLNSKFPFLRFFDVAMYSTNILKLSTLNNWTRDIWLLEQGRRTTGCTPVTSINQMFHCTLICSEWTFNSVQWNLRIKDTLGAELFSFIRRLSSGGRFESVCYF